MTMLFIHVSVRTAQLFGELFGDTPNPGIAAQRGYSSSPPTYAFEDERGRTSHDRQLPGISPLNKGIHC